MHVLLCYRCCCGIRISRNFTDSNVCGSEDSHTHHVTKENKSSCGDYWLECDDENVRPITDQKFQELLGYKQNSTSTPYLLFYLKVINMDNDD